LTPSAFVSLKNANECAMMPFGGATRPTLPLIDTPLSTVMVSSPSGVIANGNHPALISPNPGTPEVATSRSR
jgi:hypothetical protein